MMMYGNDWWYDQIRSKWVTSIRDIQISMSDVATEGGTLEFVVMMRSTTRPPPPCTCISLLTTWSLIPLYNSRLLAAIIIVTKWAKIMVMLTNALCIFLCLMISCPTCDRTKLFQTTAVRRWWCVVDKRRNYNKDYVCKRATRCIFSYEWINVNLGQVSEVVVYQQPWVRYLAEWWQTTTRMVRRICH